MGGSTIGWRLSDRRDLRLSDHEAGGGPPVASAAQEGRISGNGYTIDLAGRRALVTGAGQHTGRQFALGSAQAGAEVFVNDVVADKAEAVCDEIRTAGGAANPLVFDITDLDATNAAIGGALPDIVVNNVGGVDAIPYPFVHFAASDPTRWKKLIDLNLYGVLNTTFAALPHMTQQKWGRIVTIISDAGRRGERGQAVYGRGESRRRRVHPRHRRRVRVRRRHGQHHRLRGDPVRAPRPTPGGGAQEDAVGLPGEASGASHRSRRPAGAPGLGPRRVDHRPGDPRRRWIRQRSLTPGSPPVVLPATTHSARRLRSDPATRPTPGTASSRPRKPGAPQKS